MIKVYLAGDVSEDRWRLKVIKECRDCPIEWLSPIDGYSYDPNDLIGANATKLTFHLADRMKLEKADVVFAYIRAWSNSAFSGTSWELGYAKALGKTIIVVNDMMESRRYLYELVHRMADSYHLTMDDGIHFLRDLSLEMEWRQPNAQETTH